MGKKLDTNKFSVMHMCDFLHMLHWMEFKEEMI